MSGFTVEKDWVTAAGLRAAVIMGSMGHRCGYVGIPTTHPLHGVDYSEAHDSLSFPADEPVGKRGIIPLICADGEARPDVVFNVHGGLTYSGGKDDYPVASDGLWWFGYDCGHAGDGRDEAYIAAKQADHPEIADLYENHPGDIVRSLDYCIAECESLAQQLIDRIKGGDQ